MKFQRRLAQDPGLDFVQNNLPQFQTKSGTKSGVGLHRIPLSFVTFFIRFLLDHVFLLQKSINIQIRQLPFKLSVERAIDQQFTHIEPL